MQYQVPQFIDVEDRIFGPLTLRQFLYLAGAGAGSFFLFFLMTTKVWIGVTALFFVIAASLAFIKINGRTLPVMAGYVFRYFWLPKFYVWKYTAPNQAGAMTIRDLPQEERAHRSPLQNLMLKFHGGSAQPTQPHSTTATGRQSS